MIGYSKSYQDQIIEIYEELDELYEKLAGDPFNKSIMSQIAGLETTRNLMEMAI